MKQWTRETIGRNTESLIQRYGRTCCVFLTITWPPGVCQGARIRRWSSFRRGRLFRGGFRGVRVFEPHASGAMHLHAVLARPGFDYMGKGFDWAAWQAAEDARRAGNLRAAREFTRQYARSATAALRSLWGSWRHYPGFGRVQVLPLRSEVPAAQYLCGYIGKAGGKLPPHTRRCGYVGDRGRAGDYGWRTHSSQATAVESPYRFYRERFAKAAAAMGYRPDEVKPWETKPGVPFVPCGGNRPGEPEKPMTVLEWFAGRTPQLEAEFQTRESLERYSGLVRWYEDSEWCTVHEGSQYYVVWQWDASRMMYRRRGRFHHPPGGTATLCDDSESVQLLREFAPRAGVPF